MTLVIYLDQRTRQSLSSIRKSKVSLSLKRIIQSDFITRVVYSAKYRYLSQCVSIVLSTVTSSYHIKLCRPIRYIYNNICVYNKPEESYN